MNRDYEIFYMGLKGLTNSEACTEIFKKIELLSRKREENNRATMFEAQLRQLLDKTGELDRGEIFKLDKAFQRR